MSIETFRRRAYEKGHIKHLDMSPEGIYKKQVDSIAQIANTEGFKEIRDYWKKFVELQNMELDRIDAVKHPTHAAIVLDRRKTANKFLSFLENLLKAVE